MNYNKKGIEGRIKALESAIKMEEVIREVLQDFKKYKKMDIRFIRALKEKGYPARIYGRGSVEIHDKVEIFDIEIEYREDVDVCLYAGENTDGFAWKKIEERLTELNYPNQLQAMTKRKERFESERARLEELYQAIKAEKFWCFDMWTTLREMDKVRAEADK